MKTETLFEGKHLRLVRRGSREFVERTKATAVVAVIALTDKAELLLIEQERLPVNGRVIELPAGLVGDVEGEAHETVCNAAQRELLEETGYEAEKIEMLFSGPPSAGQSSEVITFCRAIGVKCVNQGGGVEGEKIVTHKVPRATVFRWLSDQIARGFMIDLKVYAGLAWLELRNK